LNVRHLAELAGLLSVHALQIVESPAHPPVEVLDCFTQISSRRAEAWEQRMEMLCTGSHFWSALYPDDPRTPLMEEILVSEILSRVVAAFLTAWGQQHGEKAVCRFAGEVFNEHQLARRMALLQMVEMAESENPAVRKLDRLRRLAERWTDILLGPLSCRYSLGPLVFDPARSTDYGEAILPHLTSPAGSGLLSAGLRTAFPESITGVPSHAGYHREIAAAVLGLLPEDLFGHDGVLLPLRSVRLLRSIPSQDTQPAKTSKSARQNPQKTQTPSKLSFSQLRRRQQKP
jgi:hypothetical protein